jgi:uncharacterized metal-binding protein
MENATHAEQVLLIPCSGIGKVHGLISREAVYKATDTLGPDGADTVCLALLVTGDPETRQKGQQQPCITLDGCPKLCAQKNVQLSGGQGAQAVRVYGTLKRPRGGKFGLATALTEQGWDVVDEIAAEVAETARAAATE